LAPSWVRTTPELETLVEHLRACPEIGVDTEGDSLHHYPERLALIQIGEPDGAAWLVDPLTIADLSPLAPLFAAGRPLVVLHAGDNDLVHLKRRYRFTFGAIFDTSLAARFLGIKSLGLDVLIRDHLGIELPPSRQKDDWSSRPLSEAQEHYAAADVQHLMPLADRLRDELAQIGRLAWVEEECAALAADPPTERVVDPDAYLGLKGARELPLPSLAILRELFEARDQIARAADRPPFKVLSDATLVALAQTVPGDLEALAAVPGCTPRVIGRWGAAILDAVARGRDVPEERFPVLTRTPRPPVPGAVRRRIETLRQWRTEAAPRFGLDPGVLLPNRLIRAIAEAGPSDLEAVARVEGLRRWRVDVLGPEIVLALH
jgi:ribonuclease D